MLTVHLSSADSEPSSAFNSHTKFEFDQIRTCQAIQSESDQIGTCHAIYFEFEFDQRRTYPAIQFESDQIRTCQAIFRV